MKVVVVDYGSGNLRSASKALELAASDLSRDYKVIVSRNPLELREADYIILPGVGAFGDCFSGLTAIEGMEETLKEAVVLRGKPFLGICVGMQLMADRSLEHGEHTGLGWISGDVRPIEFVNHKIKVPHMGWNELEVNGVNHPVLYGLNDGDHAYFVHSFSMQCAEKNHALATTNYGRDIVAIVGRDNLIGTQFHPEKSQETGRVVLRNFLNWRP